MQQYLEAGHKIGKPSPLFAKIETARLEELKAKYGGQQEAENPAAAAQEYTSAVEIEKAIQAQGEKVRSLKASKTEKALLDPEIALLLKLKKDLQSFLEKEKKPVAAAAAAAQPVASADKIKELELAITKQGEKVRTLKGSADKTVWQPEVDALLKLKNELAGLTGTAQPASGKNKKKK